MWSRWSRFGGEAATAIAGAVLSAALLSQPAVTATINLSNTAPTGTTRSYPLLSQLLSAVVIRREGLRQKTIWRAENPCQ